MERVKKGEKYWLVHIMWNRIYVTDTLDMHYECDRDNFNQGNYFHTKKEAESMARKIKAVLKGAEVIEMPSEEEIEDAMKTSITESIMCVSPYNSFPPRTTDLLECAWMKSADWIKSKIVK